MATTGPPLSATFAVGNVRPPSREWATITDLPAGSPAGSMIGLLNVVYTFRPRPNAMVWSRRAERCRPTVHAGDAYPAGALRKVRRHLRPPSKDVATSQC